MISQLLASLKDPARRGNWFATFYLIGILVTAWSLFSLRSSLVYDGGVTDNSLATWVYINLYVTVGITLGLGITAINFLIKYRKEVVVYIEKKEERTAQQSNASGSTESINLESFKKILSQQKENSAQAGLNQFCKLLQAGQGALYRSVNREGKRLLELEANFALVLGESETIAFEYGEGLVGQAATSGISLYIDEIPEGYINIISGLGTAQPKYLFVLPLKSDGEVKGVIELATFTALSENTRKQAEELATVLAETLTKK